jgi:hypothetical protein
MPARGLEAIGELKGIGHRLAVYPGDRSDRAEDGIEALPIGGFLDAWEG